VKQNALDSPGILIPPPVFFFACLIGGLLLEYYFPIYIMDIPLILRLVSGGILLLASGFLGASGFYALIRNKTTFHTGKSTSRIVTSGSYRFSRNPLYLALLLLMAGIAVLHTSVWLLLAVPALYLILLIKAVKPEERYLSRKFGREYLDYAARVRRWI